MTNQSFLPKMSATNSFREMIDGGKGARRVPTGCGKCAAVSIPLIGFFSVLFGTTMLGVSVYVVGEHEVGYYADGHGYFGPGVYVQFPWKKSEFNKIDVASTREFALWDLKSSTANRSFTAKYGVARFDIVGVDRYVKRRQDAFNSMIFSAELATKLRSVVESLDWSRAFVAAATTDEAAAKNFTVDAGDVAELDAFGIKLREVFLDDVTSTIARNATDDAVRYRGGKIRRRRLELGDKNGRVGA